MDILYVWTSFKKLMDGPLTTNECYIIWHKFFLTYLHFGNTLGDNLPNLDKMYVGGVKHTSVNFTYPDELESWTFVCSSITAKRGFAKVTGMGCDHWKCPKIHLKHSCMIYIYFLNICFKCINDWGVLQR